MIHAPVVAAALAALAVQLGAQSAPAVTSTTPLAPGLSFADAQTIRSPKDFLRDYPAQAGDDSVNAVVEISSGTNEKWEVKLDGVMRWDLKDGTVRIVRHLGYPGNYCIVPRAILGKEIGGDGDPLDVVVLGPSRPRGTPGPHCRRHPADRCREKDDKLLAVPVHDPWPAFRT